MRGYDSHLIMQAISQVDGEITCIPNNMEKYNSSDTECKFEKTYKLLPEQSDTECKFEKSEKIFTISGDTVLIQDERENFS